MTNVRDPDMLARAAWQARALDQPAPTEVDMLKWQSRLQRQIKWRNLAEYGAGVILLATLCAYTVYLDSVWMKLGSAFSIMATVLALTNLHFRAGLRAAPPLFADGSFYITELERQRDALQSAWLWYVLPFTPGVILYRIGVHQSGLQAYPFVVDAGIALFALFVIWFNKRGAQRLQGRIDAAQEQLAPNIGGA